MKHPAQEHHLHPEILVCMDLVQESKEMRKPALRGGQSFSGGTGLE
jgi:hypothetical protein